MKKKWSKIVFTDKKNNNNKAKPQHISRELQEMCYSSVVFLTQEYCTLKKWVLKKSSVILHIFWALGDAVYFSYYNYHLSPTVMWRREPKFPVRQKKEAKWSLKLFYFLLVGFNPNPDEVPLATSTSRHWGLFEWVYLFQILPSEDWVCPTIWMALPIAGHSRGSLFLVACIPLLVWDKLSPGHTHWL